MSRKLLGVWCHHEKNVDGGSQHHNLRGEARTLNYTIHKYVWTAHDTGIYIEGDDHDAPPQQWWEPFSFTRVSIFHFVNPHSFAVHRSTSILHCCFLESPWIAARISSGSFVRRKIAQSERTAFITKYSAKFTEAGDLSHCIDITQHNGHWKPWRTLQKLHPLFCYTF